MSTKTLKKCSICREVGHNRRTCSQAITQQLVKKVKKPIKVKRPVVDLTGEAELEEDEDCCICIEKMKKVNCCTTRCGHKFCLTCFVRHSKGDIYAKCPLCRTTITDAPAPPPPPPPPLDDYMYEEDNLNWNDEETAIANLGAARAARARQSARRSVILNLIRLDRPLYVPRLPGTAVP